MTEPTLSTYDAPGRPRAMVVVLHGGRFIAQGEPQSVIKSAPVQEIYMGIPADA